QDVALSAATQVDLALPRRARVAGTVRDDAGAAVAGANVCLHYAGIEVACRATAAGGGYQLDAAPAAYKMHVAAPAGSRVISQWYDDRTDSGRADVVDSRSGDALGVDVTLARGVLLQGTVRASAGGRAIAKAEVCLRTLAEPLPFECESTDATGGYRALRKPGRYYVYVVPPDDEPLLAQWYDRALEGSGSRAFELGADARLDLLLDTGPQVRGRITGPDGAPVAGVLVCVDTPFTTGQICRPSGADGRYGVTTRPGTYVVNVVPPPGSDLLGAYWAGKRTWVDADRITVRGDFALDLQLARGAVLRGTVRDQSDVPIENANVNVNDADGVVAATRSKADGTYSIAVRPGAYTLDVFAPRFGDLLSQVGIPVTVTGATTRDFALAQAVP
ncbi:MAG: carboxypeptidase regulatory-like domain-containing protein, partial [Deltaproteobacteria bacterium]|nr:carboxypeptidase regulatory-like domain-containing protein [Deltaproteobacteria bacterium]